MILAKPLFQGKNTLNQLELMAEVLKMPTEEEKVALNSPFIKEMIGSGFKEDVVKKATEDPIGLKKYLNLPDTEDGENALDLMESMLKYDPRARITAYAGLSHPYCVQFQDKDTEIEYEGQITIPETTTISDGKVMVRKLDDCVKLTTKNPVGDYRERLYELINEQPS